MIAGFMAPEVVRGEDVHEEGFQAPADVFAFGMCVMSCSRIREPRKPTSPESPDSSPRPPRFYWQR